MNAECWSHDLALSMIEEITRSVHKIKQDSHPILFCHKTDVPL